MSIPEMEEKLKKSKERLRRALIESIKFQMKICKTNGNNKEYESLKLTLEEAENCSYERLNELILKDKIWDPLVNL